MKKMKSSNLPIILIIFLFFTGNIIFSQNKDFQKATSAARKYVNKSANKGLVIGIIQDGKTRKGLYIFDRPDIEILNAMEEMGIQPEDNETQLRKKLMQFKKENPKRFSEIWFDS